MELKERIIKEAAKMFAKSGVKSIRMDDIAINLGISKRTIYEIIKDKNDLVQLSVNYILDKEEDQDKQIAIKSENIIEAFNIYITNMPERKHSHEVIINDLKRFYPEIFDKTIKYRNDTLYNYLITSIKDGIKQGLFMPDVNLELTVLFFMDSMFGLFERTERYLPKGISLHEALKYNVMCFFRGISTPLGVEIVEKYLK